MGDSVDGVLAGGLRGPARWARAFATGAYVSSQASRRTAGWLLMRTFAITTAKRLIVLQPAP